MTHDMSISEFIKILVKETAIQIHIVIKYYIWQTWIWHYLPRPIQQAVIIETMRDYHIDTFSDLMWWSQAMR